MIASTGELDNAMSRVKNGVEFVKILQSKYSNEDIKASITHYLETPTSVGEWEQIITDTARKYLQQ
jgi:hypothetical protein